MRAIRAEAAAPLRRKLGLLFLRQREPERAVIAGTLSPFYRRYRRCMAWHAPDEARLLDLGPLLLPLFDHDVVLAVGRILKAATDEVPRTVPVR